MRRCLVLLVAALAVSLPLAPATRLRSSSASAEQQQASLEQQQMLRAHMKLMQKLMSKSHSPWSSLASLLGAGSNASSTSHRAESSHVANTDSSASAGCVPQCTWECQTPKCDQVCTPRCAPPRCETRCERADTSSCKMQCEEKPHCAVVCPKNPAEGPECSTTCTDPLCHLTCPGTQPCKSVCEHPKCEWECRAPTSCPKPICQMKCNAPPAYCGSLTYHAQMPPQSEGEVTLTQSSSVQVGTGFSLPAKPSAPHAAAEVTQDIPAATTVPSLTTVSPPVTTVPVVAVVEKEVPSPADAQSTAAEELRPADKAAAEEGPVEELPPAAAVREDVSPYAVPSVMLAEKPAADEKSVPAKVEPMSTTPSVSVSQADPAQVEPTSTTPSVSVAQADRAQAKLPTFERPLSPSVRVQKEKVIHLSLFGASTTNL